MTLLKICGVTRPEDASMVSRYADYVGVIVASRVKTPRLVDEAKAIEIVSEVKGAKPVMVVDGLALGKAVELAGRLGFSVIQYYGELALNEGLEKALNDAGVKLAPALTYIGDDSIVSRAIELARLDYVEYVLIDAPKVGYRTFEAGLKIPLSLVSRVSGVVKVGVAGGINPGNVSLVAKYRPYLIDVSSGVESRPGVKDEGLVRAIARVVKGG